MWIGEKDCTIVADDDFVWSGKTLTFVPVGYQGARTVALLTNDAPTLNFAINETPLIVSQTAGTERALSQDAYLAARTPGQMSTSTNVIER